MGRVGTGIEVRKASIRIKFTLNGEPISERVTLNGVSLPPTASNLKYATRFAADLRTKIAQGVFTFAEFFPDSDRAKREDPGNTTFGRLADLWHESQGRLSAATKDQYGTAVRFWKRLFGEDKPIGDITYKFLAAKIGGYPWSSPKTHNNYLIALRGILALEYNGSRHALNPINGIENMRTVKRLPDPFSIRERDEILNDIRANYDKRVYAYFLWQFFTGMRPEETIALRWSDIYFESEVCRVQRVRTFKGTERDGTKTHVVRDVDLLPQALEALAIMRPHTFMQRDRRGDDTTSDIFQNPITGKPWHDERAQRDTYFRPALKRLGIRWRTAYNTRHTFATAALMTRVPPGYVAAQLGHSTLTLHSKYARWIEGNDGGSAREQLRKAMSG